MVARFLVTTALEDTWPADDVPVLFLGEWCRLYDRKSAWEKRDAVVAPYHWDDRKKLYRDYRYLQALYESALKALAVKLNDIHGVDHSLRYWRILVGPWLGYFIQMLFDRWSMLQQVVRTFDVSRVRVLERVPGEKVPNDMIDWTFPLQKNNGHMFVGDDWSELIYAQILESMTIPIEKVCARKAVVEWGGGQAGRQPPTSLKQKIAALSVYASGIVAGDSEYFFLSSYLDRWSEILLQLRLGQLPKLWRSTPAPLAPVDPDARCWQLSVSQDNELGMVDDFLALSSAMIARHIPSAYLEGYATLVAATEQLPWPRNPKAIFDSSSWNSDDVFKAWAAAKVETGSPLLIGQHGGNYGMALWNFNEDHQIAISDRFLTWGWDMPSQGKVTPVGNFKGFNRQIFPDYNGVALMVTTTVPRYSYHMYSLPVSSCQWQGYFEDQCRFIESLSDMLQARVLVRLYSQDYGHQQEGCWRSRFSKIALDDGRQPMATLLKKARIYVSTYNATTYLESLSLNFPTIIFWNTAHWELRESAKPYFEQLKEVGVFHETPEGAAKQMATVWDDVEGWWQSKAVQSVRLTFCNRYAKKPEDLLRQLETRFRSVGETVQSG